MKAVSVIGFSNSGKTTLISRLAECLEARGLRVAIAKHTHHAQLDKPDTDTALLMKPGRIIAGLSTGTEAGEAMILWGQPRVLSDLVPLMQADILLVEGGKHLGWLPRILCLRPTPELTTSLPQGLPELQPELALASYGSVAFPGLPSYGPEQLDDLVDLILARGFMLPALDCGACGCPDCAGFARKIVANQASPDQCAASPGLISVQINGTSLGLNPFTASMLSGGIRGMLDTLKGVVPGAEVTITLKAADTK